MSSAMKVTQKLIQSKKIRKVAVYDLDGKALTTSEDVKLTTREVQTLLRCFSSSHPHQRITQVALDATTYQLVQVRRDTLMAVKDTDLFVAYKASHCLILAFGSSTDPGSCIHEVMKAWNEIELLL